MGMNCVFSVVACFTLISCTCVSALFTTLTEDSPVVECGETAIFHCRTSILYEVIEVRWIRIKDGNYSIINLFRDGRDQQRCDLPEYVGRTKLVREGLAAGRVALKLFNVSVADKGTYRCFLGTDNHFDFANITLGVTALGSYPRIDLEGFQDGGIKVVCRSAGWYPEPTLVNKDYDGEVKIQQEENGLYGLEYSRVLTKNSNRTFSCRFQTSFHSTYRETSVYVADDMFPKSRDTVELVICFVAGGGVAAAAAVAFLYLWMLQRNRQVLTKLSYLEVPLDQGASIESEQTQVCEMKNTTEGSPFKDAIEQSQQCSLCTSYLQRTTLKGDVLHIFE